jgi:hypothetical protein
MKRFKFSLEELRIISLLLQLEMRIQEEFWLGKLHLEKVGLKKKKALKWWLLV